MNHKLWIRRIATGALLGILGGAACIFWIVIAIQLDSTRHLIFQSKSEDGAGVYAIVLGASVKQDGTPSDALYDRVATAVDLYDNGRVDKLLMTGDDGKFHANEVEIMKGTALGLGVPEEDIVVDGQGYRTYESCKRAKQVFHIEEAVVVTQRFHLGRAIYLCSRLGIGSVDGVAADRQSYERIVFFWARDLTSTFKAWWDINIVEPEPPVDGQDRD